MREGLRLLWKSLLCRAHVLNGTACGLLNSRRMGKANPRSFLLVGNSKRVNRMMNTTRAPVARGPGRFGKPGADAPPSCLVMTRKRETRLSYKITRH